MALGLSEAGPSPPDPVEGGSANDYDYCSGDPVNCTDLSGTKGYHFEYDLGWCNCTDTELWADFLRRPSAFPYQLQRIGGSLGQEDVGRTAYVNAYGYSSPVTIVDISPVSYTFLSLPGHPEGAGNEITFQVETVERRGGRSRLRLNVEASGPYNGPAARIGPLARKFAQRAWGNFARNLRPYARAYG